MTSSRPARSAATGTLADLIAYAFTHVGYLPWQSVCFIGANLDDAGRLILGPVARVDEEAYRHVSAERAQCFTADLVSDLRRGGYRELAVVIVGQSEDERTPAAAAGALESVRDHRADLDPAPVLAALGKYLPDPGHVLQVQGTRWRHVSCPGAGCCGAQGRDLAEVMASSIALDSALRGRAVQRSRGDLKVSRCLDERCRPRRGVAEPGAPERGRRASARERRTLSRSWVRAERLWVSALTEEGAVRSQPHPLPGTMLAELQGGVEDRLFRDAIVAWAMTCPMSHAAVEPADFLDQRVISDMLAAEVGPTDRTMTVIEVLHLVAAHSADRTAVHVLATLGYLLWWTGQGARADVVIQQALAIDAQHSLGGLVQQILIGRVPPPWAGGPT